MQWKDLMSGTPEIHVDILNDAQREVIAYLGKALAHSDFYLAGGTAAALQLGHRSSMDLDWFIEKLGDPEILFRYLIRHARPLKDYLQLYGKKYKNRDIGHVVRSLVYFADAESEPPLKMIKPLNWQHLKADFEKWVKDLTSFYPRQ